MNQFRFYSSLPPEKIPELMAEKLERSRMYHGIYEKIFVKWNNHQCYIFLNEKRGFTPSDGWQNIQNGYMKGYGIEWNFFNPFRGTLRSDGAGGSILEGRFVNHPVIKWFVPPFLILASIGFYMDTYSIPKMLLYDVLLSIFLLFFTCSKDNHKCESAETILAAMREIFTEEAV